MKTNIEKMRKIINLIYIKEIVGVPIFEKLHTFPVLQEYCNELMEVAIEYEVAILNNDGNNLKETVKDKILTIHQYCLTMVDYYPSRLLFDDNHSWTDLI